MSKTACLRLTFIVLLMIVVIVKARWLELEPLEPYLTSSRISDGINDLSNDNTRNNVRIYEEKRCQSIYGILPCADTMLEGVFLMILYTHLMMLGEQWIHDGSEALFILLGDKKFGASVFRVLMALPRIVIVVAGGLLSTKSIVQNQVDFGMRMYAGSTIITLTLIWGLHIIFNKDKLRGKEPLHEEEPQQDSSTKCFHLVHKLSILNDDGVNIDESTRKIVGIMLLSLIPFAIVEVAALTKSTNAILFALIVSLVSLAIYFAYQIGDPWVQYRSLAYLKEENLRIRFFYHVQRLAEDNLIDEHGDPNFEAFKRVFEIADKDKDKCISHDELEGLIKDVFKLEEDRISKDYAKAEILTHFDDDSSEKINWLEFKKGCTKWLKKWKKDANISNSNTVSKNIWKQVVKVAIQKKRENLTRIEQIMPRILRQLLEEREIVKPNGEADREKIEKLFSEHDLNGDDKIHQDELTELIERLRFGVSLDHNTIFKEIEKDFHKNDDRKSVGKNEFVEGFVKWIDKAIKHDPSIKDPKHAIAKFEEDCWADIDTPINMLKPKTSITFLVLGVVVMLVISGAFMQSVIQFSNAANIPFNLTSFFVFPIVMNSKMAVTSLFHEGHRVSKNASLTFSEIYNGLVMSNLLGLFTLLTSVYFKGLSWTYSNEVLIIILPCLFVGVFALKRDTYPLWASILAMFLYPTFLYVYFILGS